MKIPVVIVGLNPSRKGHNESGIPFRTKEGSLTPSGRPLIGALNQIGYRLEHLYFTELTKCHAPDNKPTSAEIENCKHYLAEEITLIQPVAMIALGATVKRQLRDITVRKGIKLFSIKHPSYVQRFLSRKRRYYWRVLQGIFKASLK